MPGHTLRPKLFLLLASALLAVCAFTALGIWQVERLAWKEALIARVNARVHARPIAAPGPRQWPGLDRANAEYLRVFANGHYLNDRETLVQAVTEQGPGFWVLTPFETDAGFGVLVNRGFVPTEQKDQKSRMAGLIAGATTLTGLLRISEPKGGFLRANAPQENRWYSRDVEAIAKARSVANPAPYFIDADAALEKGLYPLGGLTVITFPNNHLQYAFTWFGLAFLVLAWLIFVARNEWNLHRQRKS